MVQSRKTVKSRQENNNPLYLWSILPKKKKSSYFINSYSPKRCDYSQFTDEKKPNNFKRAKHLPKPNPILPCWLPVTVSKLMALSHI